MSEVEVAPTAIVLAEPVLLLRAESEEERLRRLASELYERGRSENTRRGYEGDLARFQAWCDALDRCSLPASEETIVLYVAHMADPHRRRTKIGRSGPCKPATIKRALAAVAWNHRSRAKPCPITSRVRDFVRKACSALSVQQRQAAPLAAEQLREMVDAMDPAAACTARDRAVLLLGFAGALRRSEMAALDISDVEFVDDGLVVLLRRSKTDRSGQGMEVAVVPAENPMLCPVAALRCWLETRGSDPGPLFFRKRSIGLTADRLRDRDVDAIVKLWARRARVEAPRRGMIHSAHSLRAGFVTSAVLLAVPNQSSKRTLAIAATRSLVATCDVARHCAIILVVVYSDGRSSGGLFLRHLRARPASLSRPPLPVGRHRPLQARPERGVCEALPVGAPARGWRSIR